eukprot:Nitzschia sp. Nitz4//scaffold3_size479765//46541//47854//NITZ4_000018-RA/size479765-augustus-gene-0.21-mRNA-1//-1//CDS//3329550512//6245//frame0
MRKKFELPPQHHFDKHHTGSFFCLSSRLLLTPRFTTTRLPLSIFLSCAEMKSFANKLCIGSVAVVALLACTVRGEETHDYMGVFETSVSMSLGWAVNASSFQEYDTPDIFQIESGTASFFSELLSDDTLSAFQLPNKFVDASVAIRKQQQIDDNVVIETTMTIHHVGDSGIADLAELLEFATHANSSGTNEFPVLDKLIGLGETVALISFSNAKASTALVGGFQSWYLGSAEEEENTDNFSKNEKVLISVTAILSFALFALSAIIIWIAGGWLALRNQVRILMTREEELTRLTHNLQQKHTEDTEEAPASPGNDDATQMTNPSGILGVNPFYGQSSRALSGLGIKMTPGRPNRPSEEDSEMGTPMSVYSEATSAPMGITSMRKLLAPPRYNTNNDILGVKKLNYDV